MRQIEGGHAYVYRAGDYPSYTSRFGELLALFQQRKQIIRALNELEYIVSRSSSSSIIPGSSSKMCKWWQANLHIFLLPAEATAGFLAELFPCEHDNS